MQGGACASNAQVVTVLVSQSRVEGKTVEEQMCVPLQGDIQVVTRFEGEQQ